MKINPLDLLDILLVTFVFYRLLLLLRGTRAMVLMRGLAVILLCGVVSRWLGLRAVTWLFERGVTALMVALPIVFYPELRRALEEIGRGRFLLHTLPVQERERFARVVREVSRAAVELARMRVGALLVLEREMGLEGFLDTGTRLEALLSADLLENIFMPKTPLHDGAVLLRGDRILAAGVVLPLTERRYLEGNLGTRHRAGLGITEVSDALAVIVSEETGVISLAVRGELIRYLDEKSLSAHLWELAGGKMVAPTSPFEREAGRENGEV